MRFPRSVSFAGSWSPTFTTIAWIEYVPVSAGVKLPSNVTDRASARSNPDIFLEFEYSSVTPSRILYLTVNESGCAWALRFLNVAVIGEMVPDWLAKAPLCGDVNA